MRPALLACLVLSASIGTGAAQAVEWKLQTVDTPARVTAIDTVDGQVRVNAGGLWYRLTLDGAQPALVFIDTPKPPEHPEGALTDGRIATAQDPRSIERQASSVIVSSGAATASGAQAS